MNGWTITKVFRVNGKLTVARTIEEAIALYRVFAAPDTVEIRSVEQVTTGACGIDGDALTVDVQDVERHYAEQLSKLVEENERLKAGRKHVYVRQRFDKGHFDGDDAEAVRVLKIMAVKKVAAELGWVLVHSDWAYCTVTEESDGVWLDIGMFASELPSEKYGETLSQFLGVEDGNERDKDGVAEGA